MIRIRMIDHDMLIDWFQFTLFNRSLEDVVKIVFEKDDIDELRHTPSALNGYSDTYTLGKKMHIMINKQKISMGINVMFSGSACREYEEAYSFRSLFERLKDISVDEININRIDIAIDYFGKDWNVKTIQKKADKRQMTSRFRTYTVIYEANIEDGERLGEQVTFGRKVSDLHIVFYNKKKERIANGYKLKKDIPNWTRCEMRFRHDNAYQLFKKMANNYDKTGIYVKGVLRHYLSFKVGVYNGDRSHTYRAEECRWWRNFTDSVPRLRFERETIGSSIYTKRAYADMNLSKFITMLYLADKDFFNDMLEKGVEKINDYDLDVLNAYFIQNNNAIITMEELKNIISTKK